MKTEHTTYQCEVCGKKLPSWHNSLNIKTSLREEGYWSRLHVKIEHVHGVHNNATTEQADLCKKCAVGLLKDALRRITKGERASAGTEGIEEGKWV